MTVMYSFCVWFPVRLGSVVVSLTCIVESLACLVASIIGLQNEKRTSEQIEDWMESYDLIAATGFFTAMKNDPESYLNGIIIALSIHIVTCLLLLLGCFKCKIWLIYPFVGLDFLRITALSVILVLTLLIIKTNTITLGLVVGCSIFGGFLMLAYLFLLTSTDMSVDPSTQFLVAVYIWYQWFCVVSLCQIIREVRNMERMPLSSAKRTLQSQQFSTKISHSDGLSSYYAKANNATKNIETHNYYGLPNLS